jgi:hypothetical protein
MVDGIKETVSDIGGTYTGRNADVMARALASVRGPETSEPKSTIPEPPVAAKPMVVEDRGVAAAVDRAAMAPAPRSAAVEPEPAIPPSAKPIVRETEIHLKDATIRTPGSESYVHTVDLEPPAPVVVAEAPPQRIEITAPRLPKPAPQPVSVAKVAEPPKRPTPTLVDTFARALGFQSPNMVNGPLNQIVTGFGRLSAPQPNGPGGTSR